MILRLLTVLECENKRWLKIVYCEATSRAFSVLICSAPVAQNTFSHFSTLCIWRCWCIRLEEIVTRQLRWWTHKIARDGIGKRGRSWAARAQLSIQHASNFTHPMEFNRFFPPPPCDCFRFLLQLCHFISSCMHQNSEIQWTFHTYTINQIEIFNGMGWKWRHTNHRSRAQSMQAARSERWKMCVWVFFCTGKRTRALTVTIWLETINGRVLLERKSESEKERHTETIDDGNDFHIKHLVTTEK